MKKIAKIEISYFIYDDCFEDNEQLELYNNANIESKLIFLNEKSNEKLYLNDNIKNIVIL